MQKKIEKMRAAMLACGVAGDLIDHAVASVSDGGMFAVPVVQRVGAAAAERFFAERFWPNYPKRSGNNPKEPARKKIVQLVTSGENPELILDGLRRLVQGLRARDKVGTEFVPMAVTWINRKGWLDDPEGPPRLDGGGGPRSSPPSFFSMAQQLRREADEADMEEQRR